MRISKKPLFRRFLFTMIPMAIFLLAPPPYPAAFGKKETAGKGYGQMAQNPSNSKKKEPDEIIDSRNDC